MFFHVKMTRSVSLHPAYFGQNFTAILERKVKGEVEGTWSETYGFVVLVTEVNSFGRGKIQEETGHAMFTLQFSALVFKPLKGEVLDAVVQQTNAHGFFASVGPLKLFVPEDQMPGDYAFDVASTTWSSADESVKVKEESEVRLKVLQVKAVDGFCLASIRDDFLGSIRIEEMA